MYIKECKWCQELIHVEKQNLFALHVANCKSNPNLEARKLKLKGKEMVQRFIIKKICPKCFVEFEVRATEVEIKNGEDRKFCSKSCANSRKHTEDIKNKISKSLIENGNRFAPNNLGRTFLDRSRRDSDGNIIENIFTCQHCGKYGRSSKREQKYHGECWLKISGGFREGSSRGKSGWYKGFRCDSSYELAFVIYCLENNIKIERNKEGFNYNYKEKEHLFYPDFIVEGKYVEIKNFRSELTDAKIKSFPFEIEVIYKESIIPYLEYAKSKYGDDFIKLYEEKRGG